MGTQFIVMVRNTDGNFVEDKTAKTLRLGNSEFTRVLGWILTPYLSEYAAKIEPKMFPKGWGRIAQYFDIDNNFHKLIIARANGVDLVELETNLPFRPLTIMDGEFFGHEECKSLNHDFRIWEESVLGQTPEDRQLMVLYRQLADFFKQVTEPNQVVKWL